MLFLLLFLKSANPLPPLPRRGCERSLNVSECTYDVSCTDYVEGDTQSYMLRRRDPYSFYIEHAEYVDGNFVRKQYTCAEYIPYDYGDSALSTINLRYKTSIILNSEDEIPQTHNFPFVLFSAITRLDISNNEFNEVPNLKEMNHLKFLNLSSNYLTKARLSNPKELPALREIDLSYNTIASITVDSKQNVYSNLEKLNLSHNYLVEISDSIFDGCPLLEILDISYNYVDTLSISTFEGIKKLTTLFLSHNRISDINHSLFRFTELLTLDLSHNQIEHLRLYEFEKLTKLETIDLSSNLIKNIEQTIFKNMNFLTSVNLHTNKLTFINKDAFENVSRLSTIDLSDNLFNVLPRGLFRGKNIRDFDIHGNNLQDSLTKGTFEGLNLVTELDLSYQHVTTLEDYAFLGLDNVETLLLNNNEISSMAKNCFRALLKLNILDLSNNKITDLQFNVEDLLKLDSIVLRNNYLTQIKYEDFKGLNSLQFLDLGYNKLTGFESNSFNSLQDLINFEISNNPLTGSLEENTFEGLNSLPKLVLSWTQLSAVNNGSFEGMTELRELNMSHSKINDLQYNAFIHTGALEVVDLSYNQLRTFEINSTDLSNIIVLLLNNNLLKVISETTFFGLSRLTNISLAHNNIKNVHVDAFSAQNVLGHLDLSYNLDIVFNVSFLLQNRHLYFLCLSGIRNGITFTAVKDDELTNLEISFSGLTNITGIGLKELVGLRNLVLSNNEITELEVGTFKNLSNLRQLDLSCNKIISIQPGVFKDCIHLNSLNISHNSLTFVTYGIFRGLMYLNTLDMSYNNINSLENERFYEVLSLSTLIVDHNKIHSINAEDFSGTSLTTLSIGENLLSCELLVNLKKRPLSFSITAIKLNEHSNENIDGITCNMNNLSYERKTNVSNSGESERLLIDIRELLIKIANKNISVDRPVPRNNSLQYFNNITDRIDKIIAQYEEKNTVSSNFTSLLVAQSNDTNIILSKILNTLNKRPISQTTPFPLSKDNATNELINYVNKIKEELQNTIAAEREDIINEVEKKLSIINPKLHTSTNSPIGPVQNKLQAKNDTQENNKSSLFTETCVALILIIMVLVILYKFYKSRMFVRARRSYSTRELPGAMESPGL